MDCAQPHGLTNEEFMRVFNHKAAELRIPLSGSIDLTRRCNLQCIHCYLGDQKDIRGASQYELSSAQWKTIIDEIVEAGCLYLIITGGDPLFREDFEEIYRHAKTKGLLITVFTNGTLFTGEILELFYELPPRAVEITLYGATAQTYERISRVKGSFERCLEGIRQCLEYGVNLSLKSLLMKPNVDEFNRIEGLAKKLGVKFRFDAALFPGLNGEMKPLDLRVPPEEAVKIEFDDENRAQEWKDFYKIFKDIPPSDNLYQCGAGVTNFHINASGFLQPCLMVTNLRHDLSSGSFLSGWKETLTRISEKKAGAEYKCNKCEKRTLCGFCPGFFKLESGAEKSYSSYLCELGQLRFKHIIEGNQGDL